MPPIVGRRSAEVGRRAGEGWSSGMGSREVYCLLLLNRFCSVERTALKSVMAREGARRGGSSSSSSLKLPRVRWRLVPALDKREGMSLSSYCSWLVFRILPLAPGASRLVLRASIRESALLGLTPDNVLLSGSTLCRIVGESPLI